MDLFLVTERANLANLLKPTMMKMIMYSGNLYKSFTRILLGLNGINTEGVLNGKLYYFMLYASFLNH